MTMLFLYNWPSWLMGGFVVIATVAAALGGYALFRRILPVDLLPEQRAMAITMVSVITTINSLLVAFSAISVWDAYNGAERTVDAEATAAGELSRDLAAFGDPVADAASGALRAYLDGVVRYEWPKMQQQASADAQAAARFDHLFDMTNQIEPRSERQRVLLGEVLARVNEMAKHREQRLLTLDVAMPATLWGVVVLASVVSFLLLYILPGTRFNIALVTSWALTLGLAFFFVLAVDRPFAGEVSVKPEPLRVIVAAMDAQSRRSQSDASHDTPPSPRNPLGTLIDGGAAATVSTDSSPPGALATGPSPHASQGEHDDTR
ncbi:DUF4239 domain-containing protein [Burkholderia sp. Ac-20345]|uniref:bestrophin-like domain n=1 Tax=Burkholderia sp. Ac-20345 TaxID=2703891 RepID=UPI001F120AF6|nr:DUF4239 domain-containing protein [Burkholderia sp. Ac-20345]